MTAYLTRSQQPARNIQTAPLSRAFNVAVRQIADRLFPQGFDVSEHAPETFAELCDHINATGRVLIWSGASDNTIFACPDTNYAFRAWHDWHHWKGQHDFTLQGETQTAFRQMEDLLALFGESVATPFCRLTLCEVVGQAKYFDRWQRFPADQMAFTRAYAQNPAGVLANNTW